MAGAGFLIADGEVAAAVDRQIEPPVGLRVWPNSGWFKTVIVTPDSGLFCLSSTRPRNTAARFGSMAPDVTPV